MSEKLENKYQVFEWVKSIINSCATLRQLVNTSKLIKNFDKMYHDTYLVGILFDVKRIKSNKVRIKYRS